MGYTFEYTFERKVEFHLLHPANSLAVADLPGDYKLPESWDRAGATHVDLANSHLKCDRKLEASRAYANAARCYQMTNINECGSCFERAVDLICEVGRLNVAGRYCKQIAKLYESERDLAKSILFLEKAAHFYQNEDVTCAVECKMKAAEFAARDLIQYPKAIEIYEDLAKLSLTSYKLEHEVRKHLLDAGLCHLLEAGVVAIVNASERYQELDPTFSETAEYKFLLDIAASFDAEDRQKFKDAEAEYTKKAKAPPGGSTTYLLATVDMKFPVKKEKVKRMKISSQYWEMYPCTKKAKDQTNQGKDQTNQN